MNAPHVLVIDHDPSVQRAIDAALTPEGIEVTIAGDGLTALDMVLASPPDVILADYRMEGVNIFRFLEKVKQKDALKTVALLLMVNSGDVYDELTLRLVGVTDFLQKPLDPSGTVERIRRYAPVSISVPSAALGAPSDTPVEATSDLLGLAQGAEPSPFSELSEDGSSGLDFSLPPPDIQGSADAGNTGDDMEFVERNEITPTDQPGAINDTEKAFAELQQGPLAEDEPVIDTPLQSLFSDMPSGAPPAERSLPPRPPSQPETSSNGGAGRSIDLGDGQQISRDMIERIAWDVVPGLAKDAMDRVVAAVVERVVWEIVPTIAESAVKREIERLTRDDQ